MGQWPTVSRRHGPRPEGALGLWLAWSLLPSLGQGTTPTPVGPGLGPSPRGLVWEMPEVIPSCTGKKGPNNACRNNDTGCRVFMSFLYQFWVSIIIPF